VFDSKAFIKEFETKAYNLFTKTTAAVFSVRVTSK
jgi:hypothetical protein